MPRDRTPTADIGQAGDRTAAKARRQLASHASHLIAGAQSAADRDGSTAIPLPWRIGARLGLPGAAVTRGLRLLSNAGLADPDGPPEAASRPLAERVLGRRELAVFTAQCQGAAAEDLADALDLRPLRIGQIAASARRKVAVALVSTGADP